MRLLKCGSGLTVNGDIVVAAHQCDVFEPRSKQEKNPGTDSPKLGWCESYAPTSPIIGKRSVVFEKQPAFRFKGLHSCNGRPAMTANESYALAGCKVVLEGERRDDFEQGAPVPLHRG